MSRLLGIVNPNANPAVQEEYWLWRATEIIPAAAEWDYERLTVASCPVSDGNVLLAVTGPPTEKYRDGVFLKMHVNPALQPTAKIADSNGSAPPPIESMTSLADMR